MNDRLLPGGIASAASLYREPPVPGQFDDADEEEPHGGANASSRNKEKAGDVLHAHSANKEQASFKQPPNIGETESLKAQNDKNGVEDGDDADGDGVDGNGVLAVWEEPKTKQSGNQEHQSDLYQRVQSKLASLRVEDLPSDIKPILKQNHSPAGGRLFSSRTSAFVGVSRSGLLWRSSMMWNGDTYCLGFHESEWKAGAMYAWAISIVHQSGFSRTQLSETKKQSPPPPAELSRLELVGPLLENAKESVSDQIVTKADMLQLLNGLKTCRIQACFPPVPRKKKQSSQDCRSGIFMGTQSIGRAWVSILVVNGVVYDIGTYDSEWVAGSMFSWAYYSLQMLRIQKRHAALSSQSRTHTPPRKPLQVSPPLTFPSPTFLQGTQNIGAASTRHSKDKAPVPLMPRISPDPAFLPVTQNFRPAATTHVKGKPLVPLIPRMPPVIPKEIVVVRSPTQQSPQPVTPEAPSQWTSSTGQQLSSGKRTSRNEEESFLLPAQKKQKAAQQSSFHFKGKRKLPSGSKTPPKQSILPHLESLNHPSALVVPLKGVPSPLATHVFVEKDGTPIPRDSLTDRDIIMGRGSFASHSAGNVWFRDLVLQYRNIYTAIPKDLRSQLAGNLVAAIRSEGGRFLEPAANSRQCHVFYEAGDVRAIEKTCQALRERSSAPVRAVLQAQTEAGASSPSKTTTTTAATAPSVASAKTNDPIAAPAADEDIQEAVPADQPVNMSGSFVF